MRAALKIEEAGVPAIAIVTDAFAHMARMIGKGSGHSDVRITEYPGVVQSDTDDDFRAKVCGPLLRGVIEGTLAGAGPGDGAERYESPQPDSIVARGDLDSIQETFLRNGWSDGLPVIPPTIDRVERFLGYADRDREAIIGELPPARRQATVWNVAVNGVMAGCRPEYMPVLLAIAEILADPEFRLEDAGSTPGWEPLVVLSGPLVSELDFNFGAGAQRVGRQANTSVGRFTRLFMRNLAGLRIGPDATDKACIGLPFNVVLAEDDQAVAALGWSSYRSDVLVSEEAATSVTVQSVVSVSQPIYSAGDEAESHLATLARGFERALGPFAAGGLLTQQWHPLVVMSPSVAGVLARGGISKSAIREYLYDRAFMEAWELEECAQAAGATSYSLAQLVADGLIPALYHVDDDSRRLVPMCFAEETIQILVAGDPGRSQSKVFVQCNAQGKPTTRGIFGGRVYSSVS